MPNIVSQQEFESLEAVNQHIVPITRMTGRRLRVVGTGVCIKYRESLFLATANHVLADSPDNVFIPWMPGMIIEAKSFRSIRIVHPNVDVAVFLLREESPCYTPVSLFVVDPQIGGDILLAGFPASRSTSFSKTLRYEARFLKTKTIENLGRFSQFDEKVNFVCDFHQKNILLGGGQRGSFTDPWGMSGGGVFEAHYVSGKYEYRLAGILTDWDPQKKQFMRCTKFSVISDLMEKLSPSTQSP